MNDATTPGAAPDSSQRIQIGWSQLQAAAQAGDISADQAERLWARWAGGAGSAIAAPRFSFTHVLYYFGGMLAIGAMTLFMTLGWELFGAWGVLLLAVGYGVGAIAVARNLLHRGLHIPAGILATLAVCLVPLATWALQSALGLWPDGPHDNYRDFHRFIDWRWLWLELATLADRKSVV